MAKQLNLESSFIPPSPAAARTRVWLNHHLRMSAFGGRYNVIASLFLLPPALPWATNSVAWLISQARDLTYHVHFVQRLIVFLYLCKELFFLFLFIASENIHSDNFIMTPLCSFPRTVATEHHLWGSLSHGCSFWPIVDTLAVQDAKPSRISSF